MRINWKKTIIILLDLMLGVYLTFATMGVRGSSADGT